jgi:hypothetical protein
MIEGTSQGQQDNSELRHLIRELESQIEDVNAGLGRIRGTVARISYVSLGATTPASAATWGAPVVSTPANGDQAGASYGFGRSPSAEPSTPPADLTPLTPPLELSSEVSAGFWDSIAEGASWPRAATEDAPSEGNQTPQAGATAESGPVAEVVSESPSADASKPVTAEGPEVQIEGWGTAETPESPEIVPDWDQIWEDYGKPQTEARDEVVAEDGANVTAGEEAPAESEESSQAVEKPPELPSTLSGGWPDESAWSQSFEWPAMKLPQTDTPTPSPTSSGDDQRIDVSDIVAQVKAELEAARRGEGPMPAVDWDDTSEGGQEEPAASAGAQMNTPAVEPGTSDTPETTEKDEDARREEVSRLVAEMRGQIEAGTVEGAPRSGTHEYDSSWTTTRITGGSSESNPAEMPGAGGDAAGSQSKPAFRLAAPGSFPDWSHMPMEPSSPPMVVMKDVDGRVELASVYETLNELGCGDGASLLNYTPHSVTVGLSVSTKVPTIEDMAAAVEKVFGLTSRVESDGIRLTVNIGVNPKQKSEDAA